MKKNNTKEKFITTIDNEILPISKCRKYESGFYKIGDVNIENSGNCYLMNDGKYYRAETGQIVFDHYLNTYVFNNTNLIYGYIDVDKKGYFSNNLNVVEVIESDFKETYAINEEIIKNNLNYRECLSNGKYYSKNLKTALELKEIAKIDSDYKTSLHYNSKDVIQDYVNFYEEYETKHSFNDDFLNIINDFSYGLEFETVKGNIPSHLSKKLGLIPLRDGSIAGLEFATIPLTGEKGMSAIVDIVNELKKRTIFNETCSFHLHIGNIPRTKEFILAFYKVTCLLQDQIFEMFPLYKKYNFKYKNKNYAAPYDYKINFLNMDKTINSENIDYNFNILFRELTGGYSMEDLNYQSLDDIKNHPQDPNGSQKWNIHSRYHIHNLIPLIFVNKQTIEFRIHTPTYDLNKIMSFLTFNSLLLKYVIKNQNAILKRNYNLSISDIIYSHQYNSSNFPEELINYFNRRKTIAEKNNLNSNIFFNEEEIVCNFKKYFKSQNTFKIEQKPKNLVSTAIKLENKVSYDDYFIKDYKQSIVDELTSLRVVGQKIGEFGDVFYKTELKSIKDLENDIYPL